MYCRFSNAAFSKSRFSISWLLWSYPSCCILLYQRKKKSPVAKWSLLKASRESSGLILVFTVHGFSVRTNASLDSVVALLFIIMFSKWKGWIAPSPDSKKQLGTTCWLPMIKWNLMWQMLQMPFSRRESHEGPCSTLFPPALRLMEAFSLVIPPALHLRTLFPTCKTQLIKISCHYIH